MFRIPSLPLVSRKRMDKHKANAGRYKEWFESAMVMVDNSPIGVVWSDPKSNFKVTYVNGFGKAMLEPAGASKATLNGTIDVLFPQLAAYGDALRDPSRLPIRLMIPFGPLALDMSVFGIRNAKGEYIGAMAAWSDATNRNALTSGFEGRLKGTADRVVSKSQQLKTTAEHMSGTAESVAREVREASEAATEMSANVQTVAAAAEQLSASVNEISRQATQSLTTTNRVTQATREANENVRSLLEGAKRIGDIVGLITGIAAQTNLLALNATIEAARAGDAGKGFAVVAGEVKALADKTARATSQIGSHIAQIQSATNTVVDVISHISTGIDEVGHVAASIAAAVEQQGAATQDIARNSQQLANGT